MTQAVAVRSQGDDFQARIFWLCAPLLLVPESEVARVSFESGPRAFDDVTVEYVAGKGPQDHYGDEILRDHLQCKWHATPGQFGTSTSSIPPFRTPNPCRSRRLLRHSFSTRRMAWARGCGW